MQLEGVTQVDVFVVTAAPMKRIAFLALYALNVDVALIEEVDIILRKILADHADDPHRREQARAQSEIRRRPAQDAFGRPEGRFDRIKSDGSNNQDTHKYFPTMGRKSARSFFGMRARSVIIASFNADAQAQERKAVNRATACRIVRCARSTLRFSTASTCSIWTSPASSFQQS